MTKIFTLTTAAFILVLSLSGCITSPGGMAPSTVPITANDTYTVIKHDAVGTDTAISILFIPVTAPCDAYSALMNVKKDTGADALINVTGSNTGVYLFIVNWRTVKVHGDAIKFQQSGSLF